MPDISVTLTNTSPEIDDETWFEIVEEVYNEIVAATPVDTGNCIGAWQLSGGGDSFTISNPTPYVSFLEDGWSSQAPEGMVRPALDKLPSIVRRRARRRKKGTIRAEIVQPEYVPVKDRNK